MNAYDSSVTVYTRFRDQALRHPAAIALQSGSTTLTYGQLLERVDRTARALRDRSVHRGDRFGVLSENCVEYTVLQLAAARIGAMVACLNWRLVVDELRRCIEVVDPVFVAYSPRYAALAADICPGKPSAVEIALLCAADGEREIEPPTAEAEDGLLMIFTSGTTGVPKAAVISQRAEMSRMGVLRQDLGIDAEDAYIAWSPMFHMGGSEHTLASLMFGAAVIICDGLNVKEIVCALESRKIGWLLLVPATIEPIVAELQRTSAKVRGVKAVGCMADLIPVATIEAICRALGAPFLNSFGSTETGLPPLSGHLMHLADAPWDLAKRPNSSCELRLEDNPGHEAVGDAVGEALVRGPTLFSGYWARGGLDRSGFRGDWYAMGDLFRRVAGGGYHFVGRSKYLIKSGAENIYPAEIERVLLDDPRIEDAAVVRKPDPQWGEVPVAFVVRRSLELEVAEITQICRTRLAGYKCPKEIHFIDAGAVPRNSTGKIIREALEAMLLRDGRQ